MITEIIKLAFVQREERQVALLPQHGGAVENVVLLRMRKAAQTPEMPDFTDFLAIYARPHKY